MSLWTLDRRATAARIVLGTAAATWRFSEIVPPDCRPAVHGNQVAVIAFWHSQMLPLWFTLRGLRPAAVVSGSDDGEILARYLTALGYPAVLRGSSTRGGSEVLAEAVRQLRTRSLLITPDGPRGPAREAKAGAIVAALRARVPLVVAGWSCNRTIRFRSWDRMEAPMPLTRITVRYARVELGGLDAGSRIGTFDLDRLTAALDAVSAQDERLF